MNARLRNFVITGEFQLGRKCEQIRGLRDLVASRFYAKGVNQFQPRASPWEQGKRLATLKALTMS